jgi:hypothetical protein
MTTDMFHLSSTSRSFPHSRLITGVGTRLTRRMPLVEQELLLLPEHLSSPPVFSSVRVTRSLVLYVCFVDRCLSFCTFSFGHCVVCSSIYGFLLPLWYLQTLLTGDLSRFWLSCLGPLVFLLPNICFIISSGYESTWWKIFQKRAVRTIFYIYVYIY